MDHEACGPARSSVNGVNGTDTSSRSKCKSATGVLVHGASSEVEIIDHLAVGKRTRPPDLSDGDVSGSTPSLKKGTIKRVRESRTAAVLSQTVFRQATRSLLATVKSRPTRSRQL